MRRFALLGIAILVSELFAFLAVNELIQARKLAKKAGELQHPMTLKQAFFIMRGGIVIRGALPSGDQLSQKDQPTQLDTVHGDTIYYRRWGDKLFDHTTDEELIFLARGAFLDEEIDDKSKSDHLAKLIALGQVLWTLIQIIARGQQGLDIPPIQFATLEYISMAIVQYISWWHKPYEVTRPRIIESDEAIVNDKPLLRSCDWHLADYKQFFRIFPTFICFDLFRIVTYSAIASSYIARVRTTLTNDIRGSYGSAKMLAFATLVLVFSSIHLIAWNYPFPTIAEAWIWRGISFQAISYGLCLMLEDVLFLCFSKSMPKPFRRFTAIMLNFSYLGRLFLAVECFIAFRNAPSSVYQRISWLVKTVSINQAQIHFPRSNYIPHLGA